MTDHTADILAALRDDGGDTGRLVALFERLPRNEIGNFTRTLIVTLATTYHVLGMTNVGRGKLVGRDRWSEG